MICQEFDAQMMAMGPGRGDNRLVAWPVPCDQEAHWLAYNPHDGDTTPICDQHKEEFERMEQEEDMEFVYNHFPEGLSEQEAEDWKWPWDL